MYSDRLFTGMDQRDVEPGVLLLSAPLPEGMEERVIGESGGKTSTLRAPMMVLQYQPPFCTMIRLDQRTDEAAITLLPKWMEFISKPQVVYRGGEDFTNGVRIVGALRPGAPTPEGSVRIGDHFVVVDTSKGPSQEHIDALEGVRVFRGVVTIYTKDLEEQIANGEWYVTTLLNSDILAPGSADIWGDAMRRQDFPLPLFATYPKDLNDA
ncbi:MAG: YqgE/AlgH family protein [Corynebacterium sp.]|nr:YqgE/AlgH family protein [Corynebacterium sp.]